MTQQGFFANLFRHDFIQDSSARALKRALERGVMTFQVAAELEFANHVSPQLFNAIDLYQFERKDMLQLNALREEIDAQTDLIGLNRVALALLNSSDPVLGFCVAAELSKTPVDLENKSLRELRMMANQDGGALVDKVKAEMNQSLHAAVVRAQQK